jgi:hypothetical protein
MMRHVYSGYQSRIWEDELQVLFFLKKNDDRKEEVEIC